MLEDSHKNTGIRLQIVCGWADGGMLVHYGRVAAGGLLAVDYTAEAPPCGVVRVSPAIGVQS